MRKAIIILVACGVIMGVVFLYLQQSHSVSVSSPTTRGDTLTIRDAAVHIETVSTSDAMERGLSGRASLPDGTGMFFVFEKTDYFGIWMPDMHFSIDVLWFDENMHVVYIVENMSPDSYPKVFTPTAPARYILEVPAGFVERYGIQLGDKGELVTQEKIL